MMTVDEEGTMIPFESYPPPTTKDPPMRKARLRLRSRHHHHNRRYLWPWIIIILLLRIWW